MRKQRNVRHYTKRIAKETGLSQWKVHLVLMGGWKGILHSMKQQHDVRLKGLGRLYIQKEPRKKN